jgi:hypothetical protein
MRVCVVQDVLVNNLAHIAKTIGDRTPPVMSPAGAGDGGDASPPAKSPASTPPRGPVLDATSVQKPPRRRNISERQGWVDPDGSDDDDDVEESEEEADDDAALVKLFKDPNFSTTQVSVGAKTSVGANTMCLRWKLDGPVVFATAPLVKDDKYTVSPSPLVVPDGATGSIYVTFDAEATSENKEILKKATLSWIRQR